MVKFLYEKLIGEDNICWTQEDDQKLEIVEGKLIETPVLNLPDIIRPFQLFADSNEGIAYGVLIQEWGGGGGVQ